MTQTPSDSRLQMSPTGPAVVWERVTCIIAPAAFPLPTWLRACAEMDAAHVRRIEGRVAVPGLVQREVVTYPLLRQVADLAWVYLAWRGRIVARQAGAGTGILEATHLRGMHPLLAAAMRPGARYTWVYATPEYTPEWPTPGALQGLVPAGSGPTVAPTWLHGNTERST